MTIGYLPETKAVALLYAAVSAAVDEIMEFAIKTPSDDLYDELEQLARRAGCRACDAALTVLEDEESEFVL